MQIDEIINEKYPLEQNNTNPLALIHNNGIEQKRQAAYFGYELGEQMAVEFAEWIKNNSIFFVFAPNDSAGYYRRLLPEYEGHDNKEYMCHTTEELFKLKTGEDGSK